MRRRTYLATATAVGVAGCTELGLTGSETGPDDESPTSDDEPPEIEGPDDDGTIDDFADFEGWSVLAGAASLDEEDALVGERSVLLEASTDDEEARIVRELPEPLDCSEMSPGLAMASEETIAPRIQLFDSSGNGVNFRAMTQVNELYRCNFGAVAADGDADLSDIVEIHIAYYVDDETERRLRLDDLHLVPRPEEGLVVLQFDGGDESIATEALPTLEEYGYPATAFVPTGLIRAEASHDGRRLTEAQLDDLVDAGWMIGSYGINGQNLADYSAADRADQITASRPWLEDEGYGEGARYFSYPRGRYDEESLELVGDTYEIGFVGRYPVQGYVANSARYPRIVDPDVENADALLERTADLGGITTLTYYAIDGDSAERFEETMAILDEYVSDGDLEVITTRDLESEYVFEPASNAESESESDSE
ncbi:polysaccharide deacetylase family protein [Natronorubrum sp. JWXQ-INN-674]|uniref:Polysaccharide deacetylase family protein n=1 Tax=Natronorubrum halalkaliphilum TaxID=2691917 RepID=A0A6B0VRX1_9EURY|nr:polysaccharide deacetylase family protein [Natronorubrum halalkaliphilum]MXV63522.1 polysaccharide deacetylase family protein [Natronorubrum halalkaliphilum]